MHYVQKVKRGNLKRRFFDRFSLAIPNSIEFHFIPCKNNDLFIDKVSKNQKEQTTVNWQISENTPEKNFDLIFSFY